jgi:Morc6 ribosomal protein S5 domain 2-like
MGCFIYHRNRLIKMYMRVGIQFASDSRGVGVIGVVDASFLTPTHNKQDFVQNNLYPTNVHSTLIHSYSFFYIL